MTIKSPATYGEHYWKSQVDASLLFEEEIEKSIKPFIPSLFIDASIREAVPFDILPKLENLFAFESPGLGSVGGRFVSEAADNIVGKLLDKALRKFGYASNTVFQDEHLQPEQYAALFRRKRITPEFWLERMRQTGYNEAETLFYYTQLAPFPAMPEILRWGRYHGDPDNLWGTLVDVYDMEPVDFPIWEWLDRQQLTTDQITSLFKRGKLLEVDTDYRLREAGWDTKHVALIRELAYSVPNAMLLMQGNLHAGVSQESIFDDLGKADIHPDYRQKYFDAVLTKPASIDLVSYHLRQENDLVNLEADLKRIGIHPEYLDVYRTLAERIPPVADIITMAVREAFNPVIAARFGQYEDFPEDFGRYAKQQGLSEEWAKRYWAAHWGLPSPQQGFEMLHRGVIGRDDLELLMKAQDIMPFWREKMVDIAYRPLTRVDVRRMYAEGILDESGVYRAYQDAGYSDDNAEAMTEFTIAYVLSQQSKFTTADVISAYTKRMIDKSEARSLLNMLGVKSEDAIYILGTADYKRQWALTDAKTTAIRNLYKRGEYTEPQTRTELLRLDLPTDHIETLMEQWYYEQKEDRPNTWTKAETFKFLKQEIITLERATQELQTMGYDEERIDIYMRAGGWKP